MLNREVWCNANAVPPLYQGAKLHETSLKRMLWEGAAKQ